MMAAAAVLLLAASAFAQTFPPLAGRVTDAANILDPAAEAELTQLSADLEAKSTDQLVIATIPSLEGYDIADYGYRLGRHWGIGQQKARNGVILLVAPNDRKVRIEVGYGVESVLTDALSSVIIQQQVLPAFRAGDMQGGVLAGAREISAVLLMDPAEVQRRYAMRPDRQGSGWGTVAVMFIIGLWLFFFVLQMRRRGLAGAVLDTMAHSGSGMGRRRSGAIPPIIIGGGGFGGGGGWSGGGGSFGGGGASGSW